jgi:uncharacterized protein (DUF2461 family)
MLRALERNGLQIPLGDALKRARRLRRLTPIARSRDTFRFPSSIVRETLPDEEIASARLIERMASLAKRTKRLLNYGFSLC